MKWNKPLFNYLPESMNNPSPQDHGLQRNGSPYSEQECDEIIMKLEQLLDGELDTSKQDEVMNMISNCNYCLEQYNIEKSVRSLVKNGFKNFKISNNLISSIRSSIKNVRGEGSS